MLQCFNNTMLQCFKFSFTQSPNYSITQSPNLPRYTALKLKFSSLKMLLFEKNYTSSFFSDTILQTFNQNLCFKSHEHQGIYSKAPYSDRFYHCRSNRRIFVLAVCRVHQRYLCHQIGVVLEHFMGGSCWISVR